MDQIKRAAPQGATMGESPKPAPAPEIITVTQMRVGCDGGAGASQGALGHPLVYINLVRQPDGSAHADCGYCDRHFVLPKGAQVGGH